MPFLKEYAEEVILEDYEIIEEAGRGQYSIVHKVICRRGRLCGRIFALKRSTPDAPHTIINLQVKGIALQQDLHHPNILSLYFVSASQDFLFFVMEYCPRGSLKEYLTSKELFPLSNRLLLQIARGLLAALLYLQSKHIVHRSLDPTNILLDLNERPKITNFDYAVQIPCDVTSSSRPPLSGYLAPEITDGSIGSFPTDMWSLGCVMYFTQRGMAPPFKDTSLEVSSKRTAECDPSIHTILPAILQKEPSDRISIYSLIKLLNQSPLASNAASHDRQDLQQVAMKRRRASITIGETRTVHFPASRSNRRVVSDPTTSKPTPQQTTNIEQKYTLEPTKRNMPIIPKIESDFILAQQAAQRHRSLPRILTLHLSPGQSQKMKGTHISVLRSGIVLADIRDSPDPLIKGKVMMVSADGDQVNIFGQEILQDPHQSSLAPVQVFTRESLPSPYHKHYYATFDVVEQMKQRTPKLILHTSDAKFTQMINGPPPDVEVTFISPTNTRESPKGLTQDAKTLRIRYSASQGLVEIRQYVDGSCGKTWVKKSLSFISDPRQIPQTEWIKLDDIEKQGLIQLIAFSDRCRKFEDSDPQGISSIPQVLPTDIGRDVKPNKMLNNLDHNLPFLLDLPRRPKRLPIL